MIKIYSDITIVRGVVAYAIQVLHLNKPRLQETGLFESGGAHGGTSMFEYEATRRGIELVTAAVREHRLPRQPVRIFTDMDGMRRMVVRQLDAGRGRLLPTANPRMSEIVHRLTGAWAELQVLAGKHPVTIEFVRCRRNHKYYRLCHRLCRERAYRHLDEEQRCAA